MGISRTLYRQLCIACTALFLELTLSHQTQALRAYLGAGFLLRSLKRVKNQSLSKAVQAENQLGTGKRSDLVGSIRKIHCLTLIATMVVLTLCKASGVGLRRP